MINLVTEDGLYCGTDPKELWDKKTFSDYITKAFADTSMGAINYTIDKCEIRVEKNGTSAIALEQFRMDVFFSPKTPLRMVSHLIKDGDNWKFDFTSLSLVPTNEDIHKINKAVE